jgi:cation:H+ antiporter
MWEAREEGPVTVDLVPAMGFALSLAALLVASDRFTAAAERLSLAWGVSPFLVGATVVAAGTSVPELVSSVLAMRAGAPEIAVGTATGSNVANIFLVLGVGAVAARRLSIERELVSVDLPLLATSAIYLVVAALDGAVVWYEGLIGIVGFAVYAHSTMQAPDRLDDVVEGLVEEHGEGEVDEGPDETVTVDSSAGPRTYAVLLGSLLVLVVAANALVGSILSLASTLEVSSGLLAITLLGVGSSLPEVGVSVTAARRGSSEIVVGNVLGSNIFNAFAVVGVPSLLGPIPVTGTVRDVALPVMALATVLYFFMTQDRTLTAWEGVALLLLYAVFLANLA